MTDDQPARDIETAEQIQRKTLHLRIANDVYDRYARHAHRVGAALNGIMVQVLIRFAPRPPIA